MSSDLRKKAKELSSHGRHGDSTLLHVHPAEVKGLESLVPGGKLPRNPKTGLPEAFFFLPFLAAAAAPAAVAGTAAAALPAITAATTGAAALGGAAAGLGAAGAAGAGAAGLGALGAAALPTAAETAGALGAAGAGGLAAGAPAAALAAPEVAGAGIGSLAPAAGVDAMTTGSIGAGAGGAGMALPATAPIPTASPLAAAGAANPLVGGGAGIGSAPSVIAPSAAPAAAGPVAGPLSPSSGALSSPAAGVTAPMGTGAATPLTSGTPMASAAGAAGKGGLGGLMGSLGNMDLMKLAPLAMLMPRGGGGDDDDGKSHKKLSNDYKGPDASFPDSDYQGGIDPEWNYFPHYNQGGMVRRYAGGGIVGLGAPSVMNQSPAMMQGQAMPQPPQGGMMNSSLGAGPTAPMPAGGGGIAQLMQPPAMSAPPAQIDSPYAEPSGAPKAKGGKSDEELIAATVEALQGKSPNPQAVLAAFVKTFGQGALQDLVQRMQTSNQQEAMAKGMGNGIGDGQSDSVPGLIDGNQPASLSSGEYVVPSDVVSHLGNGSTDAGAQQLDGMVGRTRMARGGMVGQPSPINPRSVMPT